MPNKTHENQDTRSFAPFSHVTGSQRRKEDGINKSKLGVYWQRDVTTWENRNLLPYASAAHNTRPTGTQHFTPCFRSRAVRNKGIVRYKIVLSPRLLCPVYHSFHCHTPQLVYTEEVADKCELISRYF